MIKFDEFCELVCQVCLESNLRYCFTERFTNITRAFYCFIHRWLLSFLLRRSGPCREMAGPVSQSSHYLTSFCLSSTGTCASVARSDIMERCSRKCHNAPSNAKDCLSTCKALLACCLTIVVCSCDWSPSWRNRSCRGTAKLLKRFYLLITFDSF